MPANIISGFKTCGIYPFNLKASLDHDPTSDKSKEDDIVPMADKISLHGREKTSPATTFTAEEEPLFTRWYENGYNIPDPRYVQWIEQNHPDDRLIDLFPDATPFEPLSLECSDLLSHTRTISLTRETAAILGSVQSNDTSGILSGLTVSNDTSGTFSGSTVINDASGTLSTSPTRETAAIPGSTVNSGTSGTLFTPTTSGEPAITINPPESMPHQLSCPITTSTVTPGLTPFCHKVGTYTYYTVNLIIM